MMVVRSKKYSHRYFTLAIIMHAKVDIEWMIYNANIPLHSRQWFHCLPV